MVTQQSNCRPGNELTNRNLTVLWSVMGSMCFYYATNTWSMSQGGAVPFPGTLLDNRPVPGSYVGVFVVSILLATVSRVGREYLKGKEKRHWSQRFPEVGLKNLNPKDGLSRLYQGAFLFAFIVLPLLSLIHFNDKVLYHADVADRVTRIVHDDQPFYIDELSQVFSADNYANQHCMGQDLNTSNLCSETEDYEGGVTWFPMASPIVMLLVSILSALYAASYLIGVLRPRANVGKAGR